MKSFCELFPHAIISGLVIASVCAVLGVFTILKRIVFIGITLSEVAACGIALAMVLHVHPFLGASCLTLAIVAMLSYPFEVNRIPRDAILGIIFVGASSLSILLVAQSGFGLHEVKALLYGDLILTSSRDLKIILATLLPVIVYLVLFMRPTLYTFLDRDASRLLGIRVQAWELLYFVALGLAVSAASKVAGALLIFCYLVVTPSAAFMLVRRFWWTICIAIGGALLSTLFGFYWSFTRDMPTNQTISMAACAWFAIALVFRGLFTLAYATSSLGKKMGQTKGQPKRENG
jgi:zinc transport system permease protein